MKGQFFVSATPSKSIDLRRELAANGIDASHTVEGVAIVADELKVHEAAAIAYCVTGKQLTPGRSNTIWHCAAGDRLATEVLLAEGVEAVHVMKKAGIKP